MSARMKELLQRADSGEVATPSGLAERVRGTVRMRRRVRATIGVIAVLGLVWMMVWTGAEGSGKARTRAVVKETVKAPKELKVAAWDVTDVAANARNEAAATLVLVAKRRAEISGGAGAAKNYEQAIALFPESAWAGVARVELGKLQKRD